MPVGGDDDTLAGSVPTLSNEIGDDHELVANRYKVVRWLGGGGMGRVYEAYDTELHDRVALKILKSGLSEEAIERFRREVKLTRKIQHPNVARMHDIGDHGRDKFLTMELIEGESLAKELGAPLPLGRVVHLGKQIAGGLIAAHHKGVIHRDLKPDNILIERRTDRAVLTDFGIARGADDASVTQVGSVVGTPRYMAPEQLAGREADARSDLFAIGVILYELITGTRPWPGDNAIAIAVAQVTRPLEPPRCPQALASIVVRCLELEPERRYATANELFDALSVVSLADDEPKTRLSKPSPGPASPTPSASPAPAPSSGPLPVTAPATTPSLATSTTLAVLPLACVAGDEYLADAVLEDLIDTLSTTAGIKVRPAGIVRGDATKADPDPRAIGRQLDVDHVVTGSIRRLTGGAGASIRVSARLISTVDGFQIWAHRAEGIETDVLAISEQLVRGIASALSTRAPAPTRPTDPRAVDLYLRAKAELRLFWGSHATTAADLLEQAYELSPTSAPIAGARALAATSAWVMMNDRGMYPRAREAIERGLSFGHPEAFLASAHLKFNVNDPIGGARDLGTAVMRAPMLGQAHEMAGRILVEIDAMAEARKHFETARALDPTRAHLIDLELARLDALEREWDRARSTVDRLVLDPDKSIAQLAAIFKARVESWMGNKQAMFAAAQVFAPRMGAYATDLVTFIAEAAQSGLVDPQVWKKFMAQFGGDERPHRSQLMGLQLLTEIALLLGRIDLAMDTLEQADLQGLIDIVVLDNCPLFDMVTNSGRFRAVRGRVAARAADVLAAYRSTAG